MTEASIALRPIDRDNWRAAAAIEHAPGQDRWVAPVTFYLSLCHYGDDWRPLGLYEGDTMIGFAMWGPDPDDGSHWIGGLVIDKAHQGRGLGRAAMNALIAFLRDDQGATSIALSYLPDNEAATGLYRSLGFTETGDKVGDEVVARLGSDA